jgi:dUTP pyrophosphatase
MKIKIKYFDSGIEPIEKIAVGDWIDLRASATVWLFRGEYGLIPLGVGMILPDGYEAHILPRSSTPGRFGIMCANSMGVIDNSYSGDGDEWHFPAVAIRDTVIHKGDRIAQFRIVKNQPSIEFEVVEHLNEKSRGGIGSTGSR